MNFILKLCVTHPVFEYIETEVLVKVYSSCVSIEIVSSRALQIWLIARYSELTVPPLLFPSYWLQCPQFSARVVLGGTASYWLAQVLKI